MATRSSNLVEAAWSLYPIKANLGKPTLYEIFTDCIFYEDMVLENLLLPKLHKKAEEKASAFLHFGANSAII